MNFHSILFEAPADREECEVTDVPSFFVDLNLDQIVDAILKGKEEYHLNPILFSPLKTLEMVQYRHEIMQELGNGELLNKIGSFAERMRSARADHAQEARLRHKYQKEAWFLHAASTYLEAISLLSRDLAGVDLKSRGLVSFRDYLSNYLESAAFELLVKDTTSVQAELAKVKYCILIQQNAFTVRKYDNETDYSDEVRGLFTKFHQAAAKDYRVRFSTWPEMNPIEEKILDFVARLYPDTFLQLDNYCETHREYLDNAIKRFDREIQFYFAYLKYISQFTHAGFKFCYPEMSYSGSGLYSNESFDLALASRLLNEQATTVCNDFYLENNERIFVVSGPNQGGKTTFARTFGQLHYLASLGCPVPGNSARLLLFDKLFTHFEREETISALGSALEESLNRAFVILGEATSRSIVIMNEIFSSTTLQDALFLGQQVLKRLMELDSLCVYVTFVDELASMSEKTVSMVSTVTPGNPQLRTYKIVRRPADGLAWAVSIAEKHRLTYNQIKERLRS